MQGAAHGTGGSGGRIVLSGTGGSISTARWRPSNIVSRSSSVSSFFHKSNFIRLESSSTLYERGAMLANAITRELKAGPRL